MHAVFFEVRPHPGHLAHYFEHVDRLRPVLAEHTGLEFLERYASVEDSDLLLSHQLWHSEEAIRGWRADALHRKSQTAGRKVHFADYRLRVGARVMHWHSDAPETFAHAEADPDALHVVALYSTQQLDAPGFAWFESLNHQGRFAALATVDGLSAANTALKAQTGALGLQEAAAYSIRRDYGQFDRTQAPGQTGLE